MELLNNIWNALSTPNEGLLTIISSPLTFLEAYLMMTLFLLILKIKTSSHQKIIYVLLASIVSLLTKYLIPSPYNVFINYVLLFIIIYFLFKQGYLKTLLAVVCPSLIFGLIGILILNPYLNLLNITYEQSETIPIYRILHMLIVYAFTFIIILILKYKDIGFSQLDEIDKKNKHIIFSNLILGLFTLCIQLTIAFYYTDTLPLVITFLSFIALLIYFALSLYSLTRAMQLSVTTKKLESAEEYNKTLRILHDSVRGFKHDFDNIVTTIGGYVKTNDMEGLKKYYVQLEDDCQKVNNLYLLNPEIINNPGIYNLITNKYNEAISKNIKVNMSLLLDLSNLKMKIYEFARILGILLDNAIEASQECEEKIINITFRNDEKNHRQLIIIENTYNNKDVDTIKIFGKGISEKENHTGLGLWEVQNILKKNNNISLFTTKTDTYFKQQLEIYY